MTAFNTFETINQTSSLNFGSKKIVLREEQREAVNLAKKAFTQKGGTLSDKQCQFLWNAKMRFGKTICALQLARELNARKILIVTHRPVVNDQWEEDYHKIFDDIIDLYSYGKKSITQEEGDFYHLEDFVKSSETHHFFYFASMQYLRRSTIVGGDNDEQLKKDILNNDWDLVIVDEAHEGTRTDLGLRVIDLLKKEHTKMLHLSGTPFNLYEDFKDNEIYTWDYIQEQQAKAQWHEKHPMEPNPYEDLPQMKIFTYDLGKLIDGFVEDGASFKFTEFFRTWTGNPRADKAVMPEGKKGRFVHEDAVKKFLDKLCEDSESSNYPFSTDNYRENFKHTLWIVPGVREAKALENLLHEHDVFGSFGNGIVNVAGSNPDDEARDDALEKVKNAIGKRPEDTYTITISCGRLTTGVTIKPWTAVFYMKGSEMTSAATYMQTIFRVQSPYIVKDTDGTPLKMKRECFVFDFAPDRSLKMVAATAKFSSHAKKVSKKKDEDEDLTQEELDKETMREFLKLCPVISLDGGAMVEYDANKLFSQLESVYIDRLVTSGFNDNCLYNADELMKMDSEALNALGKKIGQSSNMDKPTNATPNETLQLNQLTEEQRRQIEEAKKKIKENKKNKKDPYEGLSDEEIAAREAEKEAKEEARKERQKRISNIRGIALRIPLLMYGGADAGDLEEDITVDNFTRKIKEESWEEFMPRGITKSDFNAIRKCFNATRFEEAGKRYRALAREADEMHVEDRIQRIADIFSCFHNPDKETVLTPWRVVNMHMSDTLGGYCFFNEQFNGPNQKAVKDEKDNIIDYVNTREPRFVDNGEVTSNVFENSDSKILEINSKTGLYPLYVTYSLYRNRMKDFYDAELIEERSVEEEQVVWDDIIANNIFVICNTPMAAQITKRTLFGFREEKQMNIKSYKLIENAVDNSIKLSSTIKSIGFWLSNKDKNEMKFNAIVGNPPYQLNDGSGASDDAANPIYQEFVKLGKMMNPDYLSLIMPSKWMIGGKSILKPFRKEMMNDRHISQFHDFVNDQEIFENAHNDGGICYFLWDKKYQGKALYTYKPVLGNIHITKRYLDEGGYDIVIRDINRLNIINKTCKQTSSFVSIVSKTKPFGIRKDVFNNPSKYKDFHISMNPFAGSLPIKGVKGIKGGAKRVTGYILPSVVTKNHSYINKYKIFFTTSYSSSATIPPEDITANPGEICTETFLVIGPFKSQTEQLNCHKYIQTALFRILLYFGHGTMQVSPEVFKFIPLQDFSDSSDIIWDTSIENINKQLFEKYNLSTTEIEFIINITDKRM